MSKTIQEIANIAAEWWADKVISPKFDNGDSGLGGFFAMTMATQLVKDIDNTQRKKFVDTLSEYISERLNSNREPYLDVDYGACQSLSEAAEKAGISENNFPWKTYMWVDKNHVSASYGYRGEEEILYANKTFWRKRIESCNNSIQSYESGEYCSYMEDGEEKQKHIAEMISKLKKDITEYEVFLAFAED